MASQCSVVVVESAGVHAVRPRCFRLLCRPRSEVGAPSSAERARRTMRKKTTDEANRPSVGDEKHSNQELLLDLIGRTNKSEAIRRKYEKRESEVRTRRLLSSSPNSRTAKQATDSGLPLPARQAPFEPTAEVPAKGRNVLTSKQPAGRERSTTPNAARVQDAPPSPDTVQHPQKLNVVSPAVVSGSVRHGMPLGPPKAVSTCNAAFMFPDSPPALYGAAKSGARSVAKPARPNGPLSRAIPRNGNKATAGMPPVPNSQSAEGKALKRDTSKSYDGGALQTLGGGAEVITNPSPNGRRTPHSPAGRRKKPSGAGMESPVPRKARVRTPSPVMKGGPSSTTATQPRRGNSPGAKGGRQNVTAVAGMSHNGGADNSYTSTSSGLRKPALLYRDHRKYGGHGVRLVGTDDLEDDGEDRWVILWHHPWTTRLASPRRALAG